MQTELKALKSRVNNAEERISDLEARIMEITQLGQQTENQMKNMKAIIRDLLGNIKWANLDIIGIPEGKEKEEGIENRFEEIMAENFPNLKDTDIKIQEAQKAPNKLKPNRPTPRHIIIKMAKDKDKKRILKAAREKQSINYKGTPIRLSRFLYRNTPGQKRVERYIQSSERKKNCSLDNTIQQEYHLKSKGK